MRILAIRGCNLNSLADPFAIDFTAEPLRSAGLFAITGDTGAGKSTLLDALCLALYGECPRLRSVEAREAVTDPGGELQANDARSCLRKGAASGYAEVDYLGNDGVRYQARWAARRARNKTDGKLQAAERSLRNLDTDQIEASSETLVRERVPQTTGLTYDEFRRTVLLAQGEFDALLRASAADRAVLLEKITGTEIYRDISRRAFERCQAEEARVKALQDRRGEHRVMSPQERADLLRQCEDLVGEDERSAGEIAVIEQMIARHDLVRKAREDLTTAEGRLNRAATAAAEAEEDRRRLQLLAAAEPLRAPFGEAQRCAQSLRNADAAYASARASRAFAEERHFDAAAASEAAAAAFAETDREAQAFSPQWDRAIALDAAVAQARAELEIADLERAAAFSACEKAEADAQTTSSDLATARMSLEASRATLAEISGLKPLGERWPEISGKIEKQAEFRNDLARCEADAAGRRSGIAALESQLKAFAELDEADRRERQALEARIADLEAARRAMDETAIETRDAALGRLADQLRALTRAAADWRRARQDHESAELSTREARDEKERAGADQARAQTDLVNAQAVHDASSDLLEQAQAAMSDAAQRLRLRLRPGQPCPVCGACEHPMHGETALAELATGLQAKVADAKASIRRAEAALLAARSRIAAEDGKLQQAIDSSSRSEAQIAQAEQAYAQTREAAQAAWTAQGLQDDLPPIDVFDDSFLARVELERETGATVLQNARALRIEIADLTRARDQRAADIEVRAAAGEADRERLGESRTALRLCEQAAHTLRDRILSSNRELEPWIAPAGIHADDLNRDLPGCLDALRSASRAWSDAVLAVETAEAQMRRHEPAAHEAANRLSRARDAREKAQDAAATRRDEWDRARAARSELLGGEATEVHKGRVLAARAQADRRLSETRQEAARLAAALAAAVEAFRTAEEQRAQALSARDEAGTALSRALAKAGLESAQAETLLASSADEANALRDRLHAIDREVIGAEAALAERSRDYENALAAGVPEIAREALAARCEAMREQQRERLAQVGGLRRALQEDEARQAQVADIDRDIAAASEIAKVWREVSEAIGSRDGAKFSRFAQSVTLDLLLALANVRLADLNPRYSLVKAGDLGFQVMDSDFGDELRATRSLSGGERFLVSLAMALALSSLGGRQTFADTLFIDEGFGSLDSDTLDVAIAALETLQSQGRNVGVISHVEAMKDRIPVQIRVQKQGGGRSCVRVVGHEEAA